MDILTPIVVVAVLILFNGLFVAAEFGLIAVPPTRIAQRAETGDRAARRVLRVLRDIDGQNRYLATAQIGITMVSLGLGMYGEHALAQWLLAPLAHYTALAEPLAHTFATVFAVVVLTFLHVVFGEMVAKSLALSYAEATALRLAIPMALMQRLLSPVIVVLNGLGNLITRRLGIPPADAHARLVSSKDLEYIVEESYASGLIEASEQLLIENIFDLKERTVGQAMTPRTHITGIGVNDSAEEVLQLICEERYSRYPIYEENLDHIIGVLHIKDLARYQLSDASEPFDLRQFAQRRPVVYVPETVPLDEMMARFRQEHVPLIVVVDEFGGTAGILTLEDMVEEVVGEIQDEFDVEGAPFEPISEYELRVQGTVLLDELNQHYHLSLAHHDVNTVGGLIMAQLGRIPVPGDQVDIEAITFIVETMDGNAVETARLLLPGHCQGSDF